VINIQPIPPSQVAEAINKTGESVINIGQGLAYPLAAYIALAVGVTFVVGLVLHVLGLTKRILAASISLAFGMVVLLLFTGHPLKIVGIVLGGIEGFFKHLGN
jgi:hypothetical protein